MTVRVGYFASIFLPLALLRVAFAADAAAEPATLSTSVLALIVPLMVIVLALAALWWVLRRRSAYGGATGPARVVQIIAVGPRERILLIDHASRRMMVGVTATSIRLIAELDGETERTTRAHGVFNTGDSRSGSSIGTPQR